MKPKLLECTLRDGSYAIDFQVTTELTRNLCKELDVLGFDYIEIGHGIGIGAEKQYRPAVATDEEYGEAAASVVRKSKWGMFAQPHISSPEDILRLRDIGMDFIRIGVDVTDLSRGIDLAEFCGQNGLTVFINLMKSYKCSIQQMKEICALLNRLDFLSGFYLVDSAGGMLTSQVDSLSKEIRSTIRESVQLGFHGHDNLGLAISHSMLVLKNGFSIVDTTLQGIGRSSGNTATERFVALLEREGLRADIDIIETMKLSERRIRPLLPRAGHSGLDTMAGYALFHTSYMDQLLHISSNNRIDPYSFMQAVGSNSLSELDLDSIVHQLVQEKKLLEEALPLDKYPGNEQL